MVQDVASGVPMAQSTEHLQSLLADMGFSQPPTTASYPHGDTIAPTADSANTVSSRGISVATSIVVSSQLDSGDATMQRFEQDHANSLAVKSTDSGSLAGAVLPQVGDTQWQRATLVAEAAAGMQQNAATQQLRQAVAASQHLGMAAGSTLPASIPEGAAECSRASSIVTEGVAGTSSAGGGSTDAPAVVVPSAAIAAGLIGRKLSRSHAGSQPFGRETSCKPAQEQSQPAGMLPRQGFIPCGPASDWGASQQPPQRPRSAPEVGSALTSLLPRASLKSSPLHRELVACTESKSSCLLQASPFAIAAEVGRKEVGQTTQARRPRSVHLMMIPVQDTTLRQGNNLLDSSTRRMYSGPLASTVQVIDQLLSRLFLPSIRALWSLSR